MNSKNKNKMIFGFLGIRYVDRDKQNMVLTTLIEYVL